jgi:hypothetical protein
MRQAQPSTLEEAIVAAQSYRSAKVSSSKSRREKKRIAASDSFSSSWRVLMMTLLASKSKFDPDDGSCST